MSDNSSKIIFVTGGTGYIGYVVITQLLEARYQVRAAARSAKVAGLTNAVKNAYPSAQFEVLHLDNVFSDDLSAALKDAYGIIHLAAPLPGKSDSQTLYNISRDGSRHIAEQALNAGVKKIVATTTIFSWPHEGPYGPDDFTPFTSEVVGDSDVASPLAYAAGKRIADETFIAFTKEHPEIDITLLGPGTVLGPFGRGFEHLAPEVNYAAFSTNGYIYRLLRPDNKQWSPSGQVNGIDVRDVSRIHIRALESSPTKGTVKRFPLVSPHPSPFKTAVEIIAAERPELASRVVSPKDAPELPTAAVPVPIKELAAAVGFGEDQYTPWRDTVLDAVDSLIHVENFWLSKGFKVEVPDTPPF